MRAIGFLLCLAVLTHPAGAVTIAVQHGNIVLDGKPVTRSGRDLDPLLSPDGRHIIFERMGSGRPLEDCDAEATTSKPLELWRINTDGSGAKKLLALHSDPDVSKTLCAFDNAQFSSTGQLLYFETPAWATSGAIHVLDLLTGKERFFIAGGGVKVLASCKDPKYRDDIIVGQHRYFVFSGSYDWDFLFTPDGKEVGPLGDGDHATDIADACD